MSVHRLLRMKAIQTHGSPMCTPLAPYFSNHAPALLAIYSLVKGLVDKAIICHELHRPIADASTAVVCMQ